MSYCGYLVPDGVRSTLESQFPFKFGRVLGHHVTEHMGHIRESDDCERLRTIRIEAYTVTDGIEAFVVSVDNCVVRPDGKFYHITWSLDPKVFKPVDANQLVIHKKGELVTALQFRAILEQF